MSERVVIREREQSLTGFTYPMDGLERGVSAGGPVELVTAAGPWLAVVLDELAARLRQPLAVVTPSVRLARELADAFEALPSWRRDRATVLLPALDVSPYAETTPDRALSMQRMLASEAASRLLPGDVIVGAAVAWSQRAVPERTIRALTMSFELNDEVDPLELRRVLLDGGYASVGLVEDPGTFSVRGDVVDIFSPADELPVRIEFYGDLVESIRHFDPVTQRSGEARLSFRFGPIRDVMFSEQGRRVARERLTELASELRIPSTRLGAVLRDIQEGQRFLGIEGIMPAFHERLEDLMARLPDGTIVVHVEPEECAQELGSWLEAREREYARELADDRLVMPVREFFLSGEELLVDAPRPAAVEARRLGTGASPTTAAFPVLLNDDVVRLRKQASGTDEVFRALADMIEQWGEHYGRVVFTCAQRAQTARLMSRLESIGVDAELVDTLDLSAAPVEGDGATPARPVVQVVVSDLRVGFRAPARGLAVITDHEVFGRSRRQTSRQSVDDTMALSSFRELEVGDLVVHIDFGVARYLGLQHMDLGDGAETDFLVLQYADNDKLYVPVYRLARVQKYVGTGALGRVDKLGGAGWEKTRGRIRKQIEGIAHELLRIHAERAAQKGYAFSRPDERFAEFEASFPYEETPHQLRAIDEVLADMCSERPMDRLLCGDVGFGKTEVAIRAAYKAVLDGRQVAVLVPTTVLADQHLASFRNRLANTGARVAMVSRFRSEAEIRQTLQELEEGKVDILIGTHRILASDVRFADLGLLVIDEEQRFGVRHKERIRQLRAMVDVLTMTATPIPRTLEMAMLGIRDLSVIMTPPPGRLAVATHVARFKPSVLEEVIGAELERGGQVFFVHNRVETIHNVVEEIRRAVPAARVIAGHAQMPPDELERVMHGFINGEHDVLVSTTIIESGIDIPNANTILINRADTFGLAQLYQLRGRVGRGSQRAYCYLLVGDPKSLTEESRRRLEVIQQHTELGSGLEVAQHDLDMRGAGHLLGADQSGHIESVGFELFSELLQEAIAELRGETAERDYEPEVRIPVASFIPDDYVEDLKQRLLFYKRFSLAADDGAVFEVFDELQDRYGRAPAPVETLRELILLKLRLKELRADRLEANASYVMVDLRQDTRLRPAAVMELIRRSPGRYSFKPEMRLVCRLDGAERTELVAAAMRVLRELSACV